MTNTNEPRALTAALSSPAFVTQGGGLAMHVANRHVSRWAPEVGEPGANRIRPLRNLGFVDRLVSPWIESAQRSASLRMFSQYISTGMGERQPQNVSWVFPRPWYQDELDWMAAARAVGSQTMVAPDAAPQMFTTRGTYVAPAQQVRESSIALPSVLHEYVAPSLSIARPTAHGGNDAYSPLVSLASTQAAQVVARAMAPLLTQSAQPSAPETSAASRMSPGLRAVLSTMLERTAQVASYGEPSRVSSYAPEMVTPPAPRPSTIAADVSSSSFEQATQVADHYAEQRVRIAELQRVARVAAEREAVAREAAQQARATESRMAEQRTAAPATDAARVAEVRAAEARAIEQRQAEIQQRAGDIAAQRQIERTIADTTRREADRAAADVERARIEERIAQRIAERTQNQAEAQRLHSAAREAAARDARSTALPPLPTVAADMPRATQPMPSSTNVAADIAAAVASLPPELATMVAGSIGNRPERAVQAIAELGEALRTVELIARNTAAGGSFESTRGPRVVMPAGLGGLVSTVERTTADRASAAARVPSFAQLAPTAVPAAAAPRAVAPRSLEPMRIPAMTFLAAPGQAPASTAPAPTTALGAASAATPAALSHVAWSDRWLARFAGAKTSSLDVLAATSASPEMRLEMLAAAAPGTVFVAPFFDRAERAQASSPMTYGEDAVSRDVLPTLRNAQPAQPVVRIADDAETPDELFAAISRARTNAATPPASAAAAAAFAAPAASSAMSAMFERETLADLVAHAAPSAPGAGLSAGLASSPFAPALRHVLPLGAAPTFDVRALFGGGLGATYLAGLLAAGTDELSVPASMPTWATWSDAASAMTALPSLGSDEAPMRDVPGFDMTYVAPEMPRGAALGEMADAGEYAQAAIAAQAQAQAAAEHVTTLRSALLSFDVETIAPHAGAPAGETHVSSPTFAAGPMLAHTMMSSLSLPMLGETAALGELGALDVGGMHAHSASYAAPGMIADRALGWSVAQERSTSDLAFDFVTPELVLAARVYGLGPAEAAQAARLAIAGPGQLTAMAGAVDRTFVQALAIENERRGEARSLAGRTLSTAYPTATGEPATVSRPSASSASAAAAFGADEMAPMPSLAHTAFGVERRAPRGAFLWPAATTAALGLNAAGPDSEMSMSVAALELLAAQAVAELGTYAALSDRGLSAFTGGASLGADAPAMTFAGGASAASAAEGIESDVLASASAMVPTARREKFNALYVALGQTAQGKSWSPAARAARALALAGRGDESLSARERANIAWDVLPAVYGGPFGDEAESMSTGDAAARQIRRRDELRSLDPVFVDGRPGLSGLSARAGEALGSYVGPSSPMMTQSYSGASGSSSRGDGAVMRAPTAAQELVQTGRPAGRHGGGEVEIPAWFEQAARKMLDDRSSISDGISLAELTLVQTAAPQQIAASSRQGGSSGGSLSPQPTGTVGAEKDKVDIEKIANEVYREVLVLMDIARARNGEHI